MEVCSICGSAPVAIIVNTGVDENGWRTVEKVPDHCPNPACQYHDPDNIDSDWLVQR